MSGRTVGQRFGSYELLSAIGKGGMGEVWKARDTRLDRTVAVKFSNAEFTDRFQREARAIAALNHPNIATLHDVGDDYLVMEYVDGEPLHAPGGVRKLVDLAVQIADGLSAAHAAGIVHRDLKPDNILVTRSGRVKILDFGLAKLTAASGENEATLTATRPGAVMGTVAYMSPEQVRGDTMDARTDQFSFGLILYELLAGRRAFQRQTAADTMAAIMRDEAEPLPPSVPAPLRWIVERCLNKDSADRYDTTRGLYQELSNLHGRLSEGSAGAQSAVPAAPAKRRRKEWILIALAAALAVGFALHVLMDTPPAPNFRFTPLAITNQNETNPVWSPDGRSVAYRVGGRAGASLMVKSIQGGAPVELLRQRNILSVSWSADSEKIYYQDRTDSPGFVAWVSRAGGDPVRLEGGFTGGIPSMSPDGKTLAVFINERDKSGRNVRRVALSSPPGAKPRPIGPELACCLTPPALSWSSDGSFLLAQNPEESSEVRLHRIWLDGRSENLSSTPGWRVSMLPGGRYGVAPAFTWLGADQGLHFIDLDSGAATPFLPSPSPLTDPAVSPDGKRIAYVTQTHGFALREIMLDGSGSRPLAPAKVDQHSVVWAPRGDMFAFARKNNILLRDRDGANERVLLAAADLPNVSGVTIPTWLAFSPSGDRVVFTCSGCESGLSQWTIPVTGGAPARLASGAAEGGYGADFSPDGQWIAYVHTRPARPTVLAKLRVGRGEPPVVLLEERCISPAWSPTGEWIACDTGDAIALIGPNGERGRTFSGLTGSVVWARDGRSVYGMRLVESQGGLYQVEIATGVEKHVADFPAPRAAGPLGGSRLSLSPDGKSVAFSVLEQDGDIWILDGFQPPRTFWERFWPWKH